MTIKQQNEQTLRIQGQAPLIHAINKSVRDLKRAGYTRGEIKGTIIDLFGGLDSKIDNHIRTI